MIYLLSQLSLGRTPSLSRQDDCHNSRNRSNSTPYSADNFCPANCLSSYLICYTPRYCHLNDFRKQHPMHSASLYFFLVLFFVAFLAALTPTFLPAADLFEDFDFEGFFPFSTRYLFPWY